MASRDEFEAAVDAVIDATYDDAREETKESCDGVDYSRAALLSLWPEPVTCETCGHYQDPAYCGECRLTHEVLYTPKERADAQ